MRNNETGEYELVVGNRQLLSGFFIVVILCAVAFAMGYVVGQNSPRTAKLTSEQAAQSSAADGRPQPASPAVPSATANPPAAPPETPPAESTEAGATGSVAAAPPPQPSTQPAQEATPAPATAPTPAASAADAPPGSCWQVLATVNQEAARTLVQTLKDKGFPAALSPGPNNYTRVLVGPYSDTAAMGRAKTALENAGFQPVRR